MDDLAAMPHPRQLAYKFLNDTKYFEIEDWLKLRDPDLRAPKRVTITEILDEVKILLKEGYNSEHN